MSQEVTHPTIFKISTAGLGLLLALRVLSRMASKSTLGLKEAVEMLGLSFNPAKGSMTAASVVVQTTCVAGQHVISAGRHAAAMQLAGWRGFG